VSLRVGRLHGGVEVVASENVRLESSSDGRVHSLIIDKVTADDEGEYTVRASTDIAQISSTANVLIQRALTLYSSLLLLSFELPLKFSIFPSCIGLPVSYRLTLNPAPYDNWRHASPLSHQIWCRTTLPCRPTAVP